MKRKFLTRCALGVVLIAGTIGTGLAATFVIDPAKSSLTASGQALGFAMTQQAAGSLTTSYTGTIVVTLGSTIQFTGAKLNATASSASYQPGIGGTAGSAPADYAGQYSLFGVATAYGAVRNLESTITSGALAINSGSFNAAGLVFTATAGTFDYFSPVSSFPSGTMSLTGNSATNLATTGALTTLGGVQTLTIPVDATYHFKINVPGDTSPTNASLRVVGSIVATAVPEPSALALMAAGCGLLIFGAQRRLKQNPTAR